MSIKNKLFFIIGSIFILMGFVLVIYYFVSALPSKKIAEEQLKLEQLKFRLVTFQKETNRIQLTPFDIQSQKIENEIKLLSDDFDSISNLSYIKKLDKQINESLETIILRKKFIVNINKDLVGFYSEIGKNLEEVFNSKSISLYQIENEFIDEKNRGAVDLIQFNIKQLNTKLLALNNIIDDSVEVLETQGNIINKAIGKIKSGNLVLSLILISVSIITAFIFIIRFSNSLAGRIMIIEKNISLLKNGDIGIKINLKSNDEITRLGNDLNDFVNYLNLAISDIKLSSKKNKESSDEMIDKTGKTSFLLNKIIESVDLMKENVKILFDQVSISVNSVSNIINKIESLYSRIETQVDMIEQTTSDVNEMIALLNNMKNIISKDNELVSQLVASAEIGKKTFNTTYEKIEQITKFVTSISDIIKMINNISSQTNLLAMNAAIEAAHAGEYGKGFTVVADEIRILAENSSNNSKTISSVIKEIISLIQVTKAENNNMQNSFNEIEKRIQDVLQSINDINYSSSKMTESSNYIINNMSKVNDISKNINNDTNIMNKESQSIKQSMSLLTGITDKLINEFSPMVEKMQEISNISNNLNNVGENLKIIGETLEQRISKFKTE